MRCNLHGFRLFDAIEEIINILDVCLSLGEKTLSIIYGYRHGQVLKNFIRSKEFLKEMNEVGYNLKEISHPNPGVSMFKII